MTSMDDGPPSQADIDDAARAIRAAHHSPDGVIWPRCGQCTDSGCPSLRWAIIQLDWLRQRLDKEGKRDDPAYAWLDREDRERRDDLPAARIKWCGRDWPSNDQEAEQPIPDDAEITFTGAWTWAEMVREFGMDEALRILADRLPGRQSDSR